MTPTVDFYLINIPTLTSSYRFVCQLIDKACQQKHQVYVHTNSAEEATTLDKLLWIFRDDSFLPHDILEKNMPPTVPVQIGHAITPEHHHDILINITEETPAFFSQFKRILEVVPSDKAARELARKKFRFYRDKNCQVTSHELTNIQ